MYTVRINDETMKDVDVNFQDGYDYIIDKSIEHNTSFRPLIDNFNDIIWRFMDKFPSLKDIDVLDDNRYYITCNSEEEAEKVESWLEDEFEETECMIYDFIEDYEMEEEDEEDHDII